jgi:predicted DNA-binding transcriptional regulator AlpA
MFEMIDSNFSQPDESGRPTPAFYRIADVQRITALSRPTIYRRMADGRFPPPVRLSGRVIAWSRASLMSWISNPEGYHPGSEQGAIASRNLRRSRVRTSIG